MKRYTTSRGFRGITHATHANEPEEKRLIQESSAIDFDTKDGLNKPGSSYLWIGPDHHLNRKQVSALVAEMEHWLKNGRMKKMTTKDICPECKGSGQIQTFCQNELETGGEAISIPERFYDVDGNEVELGTLCSRDPAWAANQIIRLWSRIDKMERALEEIAENLPYAGCKQDE